MKHSVDRSVLGFWREKDVRLEAARLLDKIDAVIESNFKQVTPFLSFSLRTWTEDLLRQEGLSFLAEGGFPEAERVRLVIAPEWEDLSSSDAELTLLEIKPSDRRKQLEHPQILGSVLGLGFKREVFGDIRAGVDRYYLATTAEVAPYLLNYWIQAGRETISVSQVQEAPDLPAESGEERQITVSSSRLDAILAHSFGVSRTLTQEWITQGLVRRGGLVATKAETILQPGDTISCRGQGRIKLLECIQTRKQRLGWQIILYKSKRR